MENLEKLKAFIIEKDGTVKNWFTGKVYKHCKDRAGYQRVYLINSDGKRKGYFVHRLLASKYIPNPENKPCVNHKDGNKSNNDLSNLEWCTHKENTLHALGELKIKFGTQKGKLRNKMILELSKTFSQDEIAKVFNCTQANINRIIKGQGNGTRKKENW